MAKKRRSYRRYQAKQSHKSQGIFSKVTSIFALFIGLGPVIGRADEYIIKGGGNIQGFFRVTAGDYTGGLADLGKLDLGRALHAYGPILGAYGFKKAMGILGRIARF